MTEKRLIWYMNIIIAVAGAIAFLFLTFQTSAQAEKTYNYFDSRLNRIESKIDQLIEGVK